MIGAIADAIVRSVRAGHRHQTWLSVAGLALTLVVATTYLLAGALRVAPFASSYQVTVQLPESGGLLPNQDVALRGVRIGRVQSLQITDRGVNAIATITSRVRIPASSAAHVTELSAGGEQCLNFEADSDAGPYLHNGSVVAMDRTTVPLSMAQLLADADGMLSQVDPHKMELMKRELSLTKQGPEKLAAIVDGGTFLLSTLDSVLPETTSIIKTSRVVLTLAADKNAGLAAMTTGLNQTLAGVSRMRGGYRRLTERAPHSLSTVDGLFADNSDTMVQLLASAATSAQLLYLRVPALNALFPDYRSSLLDALASTIHDHGLWATAELVPPLRVRLRHAGVSALERRLSRALHVHLLPRRRSRGGDPWGQERAAAGRRRHRRPAARGRPGTQNRSDAEGALHDSHPLRRPGSAHRTAALRPPPLSAKEMTMATRTENDLEHDTEDEKPDPATEDGEADAADAEATQVHADTDAADEEGGDDEPLLAKREAPTRRKRPWRQYLRRGALPVLLVASLAVSGFLGWRQWQEHQIHQAGQQALQAALKYAQVLTSIDANNVDQNFHDVLDGATGEFKDMYTQSSVQLRQLLIDNKATAHGVVVDSAIQSESTDKVVVLVFIDQTITNTAVPDPRIDRSRIKMTMEKVDGRWRASKVQLL